MRHASIIPKLSPPGTPASCYDSFVMRSVPESKFEITLADGKKIHGRLRGSLSNDSPVVVMMHGRPGNGNELVQYLAAHYLYEQGITSICLSMYDFDPKYRDMLDCTLDTHISDFDTVVEHLRKEGVKKLFAVGHSYGGLTILGSKARLEGVILWDPTHGMAWHDPAFKNPNFPQKRIGDIYICPSGPTFLWSAKQEEYDQKLGDNSDWAKNKGYPIKFITAGAGPLATWIWKYHEAADTPKALVEIPEAHHQFEDSDEILKQLFAETASWVKKFS